MTTIIRDSLKPYAAIADAQQNMWSVFAAGANLYSFVNTPNTRYTTDTQALRFGQTNTTAVVAQQTGPSNDNSCFAFFAFIANQAFSANQAQFMFQVSDGGTVQCSVIFDCSTGNIVVRSGGAGGTIQATFAAGFSSNQWNGWNINIVIGTTTGAVHIRKNGASSDTFVATNINTQGGTGNAYAQTYILNYVGSTVSTTITLQDIWFYNGTGTAPNTFLANDVRTFWLPPSGASQTQFTAVGSATTGPTSVAGTVALTANTEYATAVVPKFNGTIANIALNFNAGVTGSYIVGLYDASGAGGGPGNLLATSNTVVNPVLGSNTFTFSSPPSVLNTNTYYIAVLGNIGATLKSASSSSSNYSLAQTFGSGFTNPGNMNVTSFNQFAATATYTANNYTNVSELVEDGSTTTVQSSTVGNEDQYTTPGLPTVPSVIYGIQVRGYMEKSDSGARSGTMTISSGGTDVAGPSVALATTFENVVAQQDTDPNTGLAWTPLAVNAALVGVKVAA